ncbi:DUF998 domain-containing protein [Glycomyces harbinensis]|uniref:DUF998 domain-containing protein n=1 Tax=Glycomyces harbinensis TaxID=58114 RepID=A0A1G7CDB7_9ACTN|nr:DUF998 domain-containing protein [Glycomyces harbinensis]SDE37299.1 Protein of unknown function [Glycomyces harbinensis]
MTATSLTSPDTLVARSASVSERRLLACGVAAAPLFVGAAIVQAATRDGFDPVVHPLSLLSLSGLGWIQITNFVVSGLLIVAGAVGLRRALADGPGAKWTPRLFGIYGIALIWAGVFVADPSFGYPIGTPDGAPAALSWHGILHSFAPAGAGLTLIVACFVIARRFRRDGQTAWRISCYIVPVAYVALNAASFAAADYRWMLAGGAVIWLWASAVSLQVLRSGR